ncbi:hypothetical protein J1614_003840 [Plenodomus biglobosus]|nr:hypothetical protein J1614_003840 [Plenodomus biglobosus]
MGVVIAERDRLLKPRQAANPQWPAVRQESLHRARQPLGVPKAVAPTLHCRRADLPNCVLSPCLFPISPRSRRRSGPIEDGGARMGPEQMHVARVALTKIDAKVGPLVGFLARRNKTNGGKAWALSQSNYTLRGPDCKMLVVAREVMFAAFLVVGPMVWNPVQWSVVSPSRLCSMSTGGDS